MSPIFPKLTKNWWKDRVLPHLKSIDLLNIADKYVPSLEKLDLSTLCKVTKLNLDAINNIFSVTGMQRRALNEMIDVRNHWSHNGIDLPKQNIIEQDLEIIKVFLEGFGASQEDIDDVSEFSERVAVGNKGEILIMINGNESLTKAIKKLNIDLVSLVAETAIWADPSVCADLLEKKGTVVWFPGYRRGKHGEKKSSIINGIIIDDNSKANYAIKYATGINRKEIENYNTCHIWPNSCYDERFHTAIPNLVLIPNAIAGLSDFVDDVMKALQYHSYELYNWYPQGEQKPVKPKNYPTNWQSPFVPENKSRIRNNHQNSGHNTSSIGDNSLTGNIEEVIIKGINVPSDGKDYTKYKFKSKSAQAFSEIYNKKRFVLAVVKDFAENHPHFSFVELQGNFPNELQGSLGVVAKLTDIRKKYESNPGEAEKRYFIDNNEPIMLNNGVEIVVCTQWGKGVNYGDIDKFIENAKKLGYQIEEIKDTCQNTDDGVGSHAVRKGNIKKNEFKTWIKEKEGNTAGAASSYSNAIDKISRHYSNEKGISIDLYSEHDLNRIKQIATEYRTDGSFEVFGKKPNGLCSAAIKKYVKFLGGNIK